MYLLQSKVDEIMLQETTLMVGQAVNTVVYLLNEMMSIMIEQLALLWALVFELIVFVYL